jgi:hypothetical protein
VADSINSNGIDQNGLPAPTVTRALWTWDTSTNWPTVTSYANGAPTKTGLLPADVANFLGVPLVIYPPNGGAPIPIPDATVISWIRWAEDDIEQQTNLLLTQTWVAAPPTKTPQATMNTGLSTTNGQIQQMGIDYDLDDQPYDFDFSRAQDSGWMYQQLRYRPIRGSHPNDPTAVKNWAYIYPLLNDYFRVDASWFVEDQDFGLIRLVPSTNIQMLPLFALQLTFQGFAQSVPGGIWLQYCAGLTPSDYNMKYAFMLNLVLATVAIRALAILQGSVNFGVKDSQTTVDGLQQRLSYNPNGAYSGLIEMFTRQRDELLSTARNKVSGPSFIGL